MRVRVPFFVCASVYVCACVCLCACVWLCVCACVRLCVHMRAYMLGLGAGGVEDTYRACGLTAS